MTAEPDSTPKDISNPENDNPRDNPAGSSQPQGETPPRPEPSSAGDTPAGNAGDAQAMGEDLAAENSGEASQSDDAGSAEAGGDAPKRPFRIGSQRYSEDIHRPKPQPVAPPRPAEEPAAEQAEGGAAAAEESPGERSDRGPRKGGRGKFDKRDKPKPAPLLKVERTTPLPSTRAPLSDELEEELQAALGEMSLDQIVAAENAAAASAPAAPAEGEGKQMGTILAMHNDDVFVELGARRQGVLSLNQFKEQPNIGDQIEVKVVREENEDGLLQLTLPGAPMEISGDWLTLSEGDVVTAHVTGHNKGGLECTVGSIRGFIPASQASLYRVQDLSTLVGEKFNCMITECKPERKNLVLSRRAVLEREQEEAKAAAFASLEPGQIREGTVRKIMEFGAFVDLGGGVDGLLHVSRLSWGRVKHPSDVLKEGDTVKVQIEKFDPETERISLSMRDLVENPWDRAPDKYPIGTVTKGTVTKTMDFGAFVELEAGVEGLVHISELASHRVTRVNLFVKSGQEVEVKVVSVDKENKRIGLSMKALHAVPEVENKAEEEPEEAPRPLRKSNQPLKGGTGRGSGGDTFGLNW